MREESLSDLVARYNDRPRPELLDRIVARCFPIVNTVAKRFVYRMDYDDLVGEGIKGVLESIPRFDPAKATFNTYAANTAAGKMRHAIRDKGSMIRHPAWLEERLTKIQIARSRYLAEHGIEASPEWLMKALCLDEEDYDQIAAHEATREVRSIERRASGSAGRFGYSLYDVMVSIDGREGSTLSQEDEDRIEVMRDLKRGYLENKYPISYLCIALGLPRSQGRNIIRWLKETDWL